MYVIIGASGFLGSYIIKAVREKTNETVLATGRAKNEHQTDDRVTWITCDVNDARSVDNLLNEIRRETSVKIVYLAAYHNPELVEINKTLAWDINVTAFSAFLNKIQFAEKLYYVSTDSVYGNSLDEYRFKETDSLNPVNFYGHCKCAAEALAVHQGRNVVRFPFLISPSITYKKHFYDVITDSLRRGEPFEMFADSYRSSLGFNRAAELLIDLMEIDDSHQIVNICGDRALSKYDVGIMIAQREHLDPALIRPVFAADSESWNKAPRAASTLMDNSLAKEILGLRYIDIFNKPEKV